MKLICQCCGVEQEFTDGEAAFQAGWDAPPHFSGYISCDLCPATCIVLNLSHKKAHDYWTINGRPTEFNEFCAPDDEFADKEALRHALQSGKETVADELTRIMMNATGKQSQKEREEGLKNLTEYLEKVKKQAN